MEVCINGYWGHVCYNGWDSTRALVVCKQLFGENISKMTYFTVCYIPDPFMLFLQGVFHLMYLVMTLERSCCMASAVLGHHQD